jgi:hypothetical protein
MHGAGRDSFGLDMIPEANRAEVEDAEDGRVGDWPISLSKCLHRIVQLDFVDAIPCEQASVRQGLQTWMWRISELLRRL